MSKKTYTPRNDFVVFSMTDNQVLKGLVMPQTSEESKVRHVVAIGPKVKDLNIGDEVLVAGQVGSDVVSLPGEKGLYLTREQNVILIVQREESSDASVSDG